MLRNTIYSRSNRKGKNSNIVKTVFSRLVSVVVLLTLMLTFIPFTIGVANEDAQTDSDLTGTAQETEDLLPEYDETPEDDEYLEDAENETDIGEELDIENAYEFDSDAPIVDVHLDNRALQTASTQREHLEAFVIRLYDNTMSRKAEAFEVDYHVINLLSNVPGAHVAYGFFFSPEFLGLGMNNANYVNTLYTVFFDRTPASSERSYWVDRLVGGWPREDIFAGFANSNEFDVLCKAYGIVRGTYVPPPGGGTRAFVTRLYDYTMSRIAADFEVDYHVNNFSQGATGVNTAYGFFFSPEFLGREMNNTGYVNTLYRVFFDRTPASSERSYWVDRLDAGWPRNDIFAGFANSLEFAALCNQFGIVRGTYTPPPGGIIRVFVTQLYRGAFGRQPDQFDLDYWANELTNGLPGAVIAHKFFFSTEMYNRNLTDAQYVDVLCSAILGANSDLADKQYWTNLLSLGYSKYSIFSRFIYSDEFEQLCRDHGILRGTVPPPNFTLHGSTMVVKVWNCIVNAQFNGLSDRPEHIAGIIGNLQSEAGLGLCPFQQELRYAIGLGLMQWSYGRRTNLENYMWSSGISQTDFERERNKHLNSVCSNPLHTHPPELLERVLEVQVNFMIHELRSTSERLYMTYIDFPTNRTGIAGARAYAELFCALSLRPSSGSDILDLGVINARIASPYDGTNNPNSRISFSGLVARRDRAEIVFRQFLVSQQ